MNEQVLMQDFCLISGLSEEEAEQWRPLVLGCWEELKGRLRASVRVEEHQSRLALACAALANHRYQSIQGTVCASVKVGDISFSQSDGAQARKELLEMVGDLLDSQGICLKGVEICPARM